MNFIKDLSIDKIQNLAEDAYNLAKPKTDVEARVYEVLSHKNWGASSSLMNEIASDTFDAEKYQVIGSLMWDGMENQRPAAWKIVFKSLTLLDHLVKNGAERCVDDARNHGHVLRSLGQFNYYEGTIDRGLGVREKSKQILEMLSEDDRVREERQKSRKLREKFGSFNKGSSGIGGGGGGGSSSMGGYGNESSWNTTSSGGGRDNGGGYGEGGIYDNDKGYSGRYDADNGGNNNASSTTPTFAAMPEEVSTKKKSKKKKKKKEKQEADVPVAASEPEEDLLGFGSVPSAPAPTQSTTTESNEFGDFQVSSSSAPAPAADASKDEFASFGEMRSAQAAVSAPVDPFATTSSSFDAFGNNNGGGVTNNNPVTGIGNAFQNMNVGSNVPGGNMQQQVQQPTMPASTNDDDFGGFADATTKKDNSFPSIPSMTPKSSSSDPLSSLINLDGLSKNPSKKMTMNQPVVIDEAAAQYQKAIQQGAQQGAGAPGVVSAGGSDAISSMMGPVPTPQQQQQQRGSIMSMNSQASGGSGGMNNQQMQQQQQFMMNQMQQNQGMQGMPNQGMQGMPNQGMMGMQNQGMMGMQNQGMQHMNMMGGNPQMQGMAMNNMNTTGGGGMNQMGMNQMNMNQMNMNQMGMNNQMGFQQQPQQRQSYNMGGM